MTEAPLPAPEYYVIQPDGAFTVVLPDNTKLMIFTPVEGLWEIARYDLSKDPKQCIERIDLQRVRPGKGEPTQPLKADLK